VPAHPLKDSTLYPLNSSEVTAQWYQQMQMPPEFSNSNRMFQEHICNLQVVSIPYLCWKIELSALSCRTNFPWIVSPSKIKEKTTNDPGAQFHVIPYYVSRNQV